MVDLSIIIVSWQVKSLLAACLDSILSAPLAFDPDATENLSIEIIVVDSASTDGTVAMLRTDYPQVKILAQSENIGFTRGNNIGFEAAKGRYLLLLNPDTEVIGNALITLYTYLEQHQAVGIVGPHTLNSDGTTQSSRRRFPTKWLAFFESTWLQPFAPPHLLNHFYMTEQDDHGTFAVDWMQGSALLARREVYEDIGGLDEGFVMYSEEMDWCKRAKDAGWQVVYVGDADIIHHGGQSTRQIGSQKHIWFQESKLRYFRKHHGWWFASLLRLFLLLSYVWQIGIEGSKSLLGHKRDLRQERIRIYWQVVRNGLKVS